VSGLMALMLMTGCQPASLLTIMVIDNQQILMLRTQERVPLLLLSKAGFTVNPKDQVLLNGMSIPLDQPFSPNGSITLQIRHAVDLTLNTPQEQHVYQTSAFTVGQALSDNGLTMYASDFLDPPASTFITGPISVIYQPARELSVYVDGRFVTIRSSAQTVGDGLAEAGISLVGMDFSSPTESEALPADGQIRVVRVNESLVFSQRSIPFTSEFQESSEIDLGQEKILQSGVNGLAISRTRIRYEDGQEVSRKVEAENMVRLPQKRIMARGTQIVLKTTVVDGVTIHYWRAIQMYATSYSPCRSGVPSKCYSGTSSGLPAGKGVVAMHGDWYYALQGVEVYIPGYGRAVIGDICGGCVGKPWIDLGYSDSDWQEWSGYVTVYFLAPAPASIPYVLQ
jgi:uncharacterized protein YabE (DUF348 family)